MRSHRQKHKLITLGSRWGLGFTKDNVDWLMSYNPVIDKVRYYASSDLPMKPFFILFDTELEAREVLAQLKLEGVDEIFKIES